jgi:hypothetical protein
MASVSRGTCGLGIEPRKSSEFGVPTAFPSTEGNTVGVANRETLTHPAGSKTPCTHGNTSRGTREVPSLAMPCRHGLRVKT